MTKEKEGEGNDIAKTELVTHSLQYSMSTEVEVITPEFEGITLDFQFVVRNRLRIECKLKVSSSEKSIRTSNGVKILLERDGEIHSKLLKDSIVIFYLGQW